jgi:hypothetical protein
MAMNKNTKIVIAVVVILAAVVIVAAVFLLNNNEDVTKDAKEMENSELKMYGNINGDGFIDDKDTKIIKGLIDQGKTAKDYPLADANQDGKISQEDIDLLNKVIKGEICTIWHMNLFDENGDGTMDYVKTSTKFPISSIICTGSSNTFMMFYLMGIIDEVKGASYGSTIDNLFNDTYKDTNKVVKLGTSSQKIDFEDGKGAASEVIHSKNVTAVISDWNRSYLPNYQDFETAGVDVVRLAAATTDLTVMCHDYYMLGLLFQKQDRAKEVVAYLKEVMGKIDDAISRENKAISAVASSMTNYYSVGDSDYTAIIKRLNGKNPLDAGSWGGTTSIKVLDNLDVFNTDKYRYEYVIHLRAYNAYTNDADVPKLYNDYTKTIAEYWEHKLDGQYLVNANIPIPARLAYVASIFYDDIDKAWADQIHQGFVDKFFAKNDIKVSELPFIYPAA